MGEGWEGWSSRRSCYQNQESSLRVPPRAAEQAARPTVIRPAAGCRAASPLSQQNGLTPSEPPPPPELEGPSGGGRATSSPRAVPPACNKQRAPADTPGHSKGAAERTVRP